MFAILSLFFVIIFSLLVTRIATIALTHTGLSKETARFQARSAFSGVGFTTAESEKIVNHPLRRRIVMLLMVTGNAGIVTAVTSLVLAFINVQIPGKIFMRLAALAAGVLIMWFLLSSKWFDRRLSYIINKALRKYTSLDVKDYASLLHLAGEYKIVELQVEEKDWLAGQRLEEARLMDEGIILLGIVRADGSYIGTPMGKTQIKSEDNLILYGRTDSIERLDMRRSGIKGDIEHKKMIQEREIIATIENKDDPARAEEKK